MTTTRDDIIAQRDEAVLEILDMLATRHVSALDIIDYLGMHRTTVYGRLTHMEGRGLAHQTADCDERGSRLWALGPKPVVAEERSAKTMPARQEGKTRDPLTAALFGPAQGAAA